MKQDNRTEKRKTGDLGEDIACRFLMKQGFEIIERNYLRKWGEIDIIGKKAGKLHFVEVKAVSKPFVSRETDVYRPEDNLHTWKLDRLKRVIQTYLLDYNDNKRDTCACPAELQRSGETRWQFDVVCVYLDKEKREAKVKYLENIIL
ncbi:MAG: YraN family protein [bacterium]